MEWNAIWQAALLLIIGGLINEGLSFIRETRKERKEAKLKTEEEAKRTIVAINSLLPIYIDYWTYYIYEDMAASYNWLIYKKHDIEDNKQSAYQNYRMHKDREMDYQSKIFEFKKQLLECLNSIDFSVMNRGMDKKSSIGKYIFLLEESLQDIKSIGMMGEVETIDEINEIRELAFKEIKCKIKEKKQEVEKFLD